MQEKAEVLLELSRPGPRELPAQYPQLPRYSNHFLILPYTGGNLGIVLGSNMLKVTEYGTDRVTWI